MKNVKMGKSPLIFTFFCYGNVARISEEPLIEVFYVCHNMCCYLL